MSKNTSAIGNIVAWLEKQGEQKPHLSHNDEIMIRQLTEYFTTGHGLQNTNETVVEWLRDVKEKLSRVEQKPVEWSEEDENKIESIIETIRIIKFEHPQLAPVYEGDIEWLKSLRSQSY